VKEVTLPRNISLLRKAVGDAPGKDQSLYIGTVSKHGYRFIAEGSTSPQLNPSTWKQRASKRGSAEEHCRSKQRFTSVSRSLVLSTPRTARAWSTGT
jgi:DNA-binding winged helix-turn-helix (wHTH) protein